MHLNSSPRLKIRIAQIARYRVAGVPNKTIALMLGMSLGGLAHVLGTAEYQEYETAILEGHLTDMDTALAGRVSLIRKEVQKAVPAAVRALVDTVTQRRDLKAAMTAAKEILDRDPDNTLGAGAEGLSIGLPVEVLDHVAEEGNKAIDILNPAKTDKEKVN